MSQRKVRQTSQEVMEAREKMEGALPDNVLPFAEDMMDEEAQATREMEEALKTLPNTIPTEDEELNDFLTQSDVQPDVAPDPEPEAQSEKPAQPDPVVECSAEPTGSIATCPFCGTQIMVNITEATDKALEDEAVKLCKCYQAKAVRNSSRMTEKVDLLFGAGSGKKYGFPEESDEDELNVIKQVGALVAQNHLKGVTMTLDNGDKAVIQNIKDNTVVRHTKATKAEAKA